MRNKINEKNHVCSDEDIEFDERFETYRAMLQKQRKFCEKHELKPATIFCPRRKIRKNKIYNHLKIVIIKNPNSRCHDAHF